MDNGLRTNALKATAEEQYQIRKNIVRLLKLGKNGREIAIMLDVSEEHVSNVKKAYDKDGIKGIKPKGRGRKTGEKRTLSPAQKKDIQSCIIDKYPEQMKL